MTGSERVVAYQLLGVHWAPTVTWELARELDFTLLVKIMQMRGVRAQQRFLNLGVMSTRAILWVTGVIDGIDTYTLRYLFETSKH